MKVVRIFIVLVFILVPLAVFAGGSKETGGTTTTLYQGNENPSEVDSNVTETGDTDSIHAGEQGMAQIPGTSGSNQQFPGPVPDLSGAKDTGTAAEAAVIKTLGNNEVRFTDLLGYNFGTGKVKDLVLTQRGTVQYIVTELNNSDNDFLIPPSMVSLSSANGGMTATMNSKAGTAIEMHGSAISQKDSTYIPYDSTFASDLIKYEATDSNGQNIGTVEDIVFDLQNGEIAYLAVSQGGILGVGENMYAVSFDNAQLDPKKGSVMLNMSENDLKIAKGFDKANWPEQAEIGAQATLGAGASAQSGMQSTTSTTSTMGNESTTSTTSTVAPTSSDTTTQPSNTPSPVNTPQGQEQSSGTK